MAFDLNEKRYVKETGLEARIARIVEPVANDLGYSLVRVKITQENGCTLQVMAEDGNGRFTITDCEKLSMTSRRCSTSKTRSTASTTSKCLARHRPAAGPGPRFRASSAMRKIELNDMLEGRRRFRGIIKAADADSVTITLPDAPKDQDRPSGCR